MAKPKKSTKEDASYGIIKTIGFSAIYLLIIPILVFIGACFFPYRKECIDFLLTTSDYISKWFKTVKIINLQFILVVIYYASIPLGLVTFLVLIFRWFKTTPEFEIPYISRFFPSLPQIKNKFYDEAYIKTSRKVKELSKKLTAVGKELTHYKINNEEINQEKQRIETNRNKLIEDLEVLIKKSETLESETRHYISSTEEMRKLLDHVLALINCIDLVSYTREFSATANEFANTITKITVDPINDKSSSIMMVSMNGQFLEIVGSNGLSYESRKKNFLKGQGFAGWIWENLIPGVCPDVNVDQRFQQKGCEPSGFYQSIVGVPILAFGNKEILGVLFVQSRRPNVFDEIKDTANLSYFAKLLAIIFTDYILLRKSSVANGKIDSNTQTGSQ